MTAALHQSPRCGTRTRLAFSEHAAEQRELPRRIGWFHDVRLKLPGLSESGTRSIIQTAFTLAGTYVPIDFVRVRSAAAALVVLRLGPVAEFDGAGGTLAMADMRSLYDPRPREIWFDPDERWGLSAKEAATLALPVTCHEIGHTLGFGHGKTGLMAPYYDRAVTTPTKSELVRFYQEYPELAAMRQQ